MWFKLFVQSKNYKLGIIDNYTAMIKSTRYLSNVLKIDYLYWFFIILFIAVLYRRVTFKAKNYLFIFIFKLNKLNLKPQSQHIPVNKRIQNYQETMSVNSLRLFILFMYFEEILCTQLFYSSFNFSQAIVNMIT